jgi:hypothetical protein
MQACALGKEWRSQSLMFGEGEPNVEGVRVARGGGGMWHAPQEKGWNLEPCDYAISSILGGNFAVRTYKVHERRDFLGAISPRN